METDTLLLSDVFENYRKKFNVENENLQKYLIQLWKVEKILRYLQVFQFHEDIDLKIYKFVWKSYLTTNWPYELFHSNFL